MSIGCRRACGGRERFEVVKLRFGEEPFAGTLPGWAIHLVCAVGGRLQAEHVMDLMVVGSHQLSELVTGIR